MIRGHLYLHTNSTTLTDVTQVAGEFIAGDTLHALSKRHDVSRQLIRIWVGKFEAGAFGENVQAADLIQEYEVKIAALERMVGRQALELELLKGVNWRCRGILPHLL